MILRICSCVLLSLVFASSLVHAAKPKAQAVPFKGAIVVDAATGNVLHEENPDVVSPPASVTKLMTFLVVHDRIKSGNIALDTPVTVLAQEAKIGGTQVFLKEKEVFPVEELLYAMMIQSANDAAAALARVSAGSREAFVELMNAKARELGMTHTTFRSPHGLPPSNRKIEDSDLTSPRDLATLSRELILHTDVLKYSSVKQRDFGPERPDGPQHMINHNHLLGKIAGVDGLKTGYTGGAGFCLAATAERNGRRIIVVTMGSPDSKTRDRHVGELIEKGFALLPAKAPAATSTSPVSPVASPLSKAAPAAPNHSSQTPIAPAPSSDSSAEKQSPPPTITFPGTKKK